MPLAQSISKVQSSKPVDPELLSNLAKVFDDVDKVVFEGTLKRFGVNVTYNFASIRSKYGHYSWKDKQIVIYNQNLPFEHKVNTLIHEMVHAYAHSLNRREHHSAWFWLTLGIALQKYGIAKMGMDIHEVSIELLDTKV